MVIFKSGTKEIKCNRLQMLKNHAQNKYVTKHKRKRFEGWYMYFGIRNFIFRS